MLKRSRTGSEERLGSAGGIRGTRRMTCRCSVSAGSGSSSRSWRGCFTTPLTEAAGMHARARDSSRWGRNRVSGHDLVGTVKRLPCADAGIEDAHRAAAGVAEGIPETHRGTRIQVSNREDSRTIPTRGKHLSIRS